MLILKRGIGDSIYLTGGIELTILAVERRGLVVKLGIKAPSAVGIVRKELVRGKTYQEIEDLLDLYENEDRKRAL